MGEILWSVLPNIIFGGFTTLLGIFFGRNYGRLEHYLKGYEAGCRETVRSLEQIHHLTNNIRSDGLD